MLDVVCPAADTLFAAATHDRSRVTVAVTLFNYADVIGAALDSVAAQQLHDLDLVVVDDCSVDGGEAVVREWMERHAGRFGRCVLVRHPANAGLAAARNQAFAMAATPYVFVLDADNQIYPRCLHRCLDLAERGGADAVYTLIELFGDAQGVIGTDLWNPESLAQQNYIDAMALIRRTAWQTVGGYRRMPAQGWEDYDLWLKFAEAGLLVHRLPEILCRYHKHQRSMLVSETNAADTIGQLHDNMRLHHPGFLGR
jgi:glycosyltransferase involved in cell wall biosynthesis